MGNEMGNNNTSGLKDEENSTVEACKTSLVDTTHDNDTKEEHQLVPEVEGKEVHERVANLASDDPERIGEPCFENQTSSIEVHQDTEVHPLGETPEVTMESTEAGVRYIRLQSNTSLNVPGHEKPVEKSEETDLQGTIQYQLEKQDSFKKDDEENVAISTSNDLEPKQNITVEACQTSLLDDTCANDIIEENQIEAEVEVEGNNFHEKVAHLATDDRKMMEDPSIENQTSSTKEQEDTEVLPLGEFPEVTMGSTEVREEDGEVQPVTLSSDSGNDKSIEQKQKKNDIQAGTMQNQLDEQDRLEKDDEEDGIISTLHDLEDKESEHFESNQQEVVTIRSDQCVEVGSGSLLENKDCLGPSSVSYFEANGHVLDAETLKNMEESANSSTDPALESKEDALSPEQKPYEERLKSSEEKLGSKDGEVVESGVTKVTPIASYDLVGLENKCTLELATEVNSIDSPKSEPEALLVSNSHLEVSELKHKCILLQEEIRPTGKDKENGEKHYTDQIQPSLQLEMELEPDCDKSSEPQFESIIVEPTEEKSETVSVIIPASNKVCQAEDPQVVDDANLVLMRLNNQHESSEDQCYQESERKLEVVPELEIISPELTIAHISQREEELVGKIAVQERENKTEPVLAIEMEETERTEQDCLPPKENTVFGNETVESINDSIPEVKQENSGEFFATENPTIDFTSWIAEALVSMNNLEAEMLGQQVTQQNEAHQAEGAAAAAESKILAEVETSSVSVSSGSETQETMGRSSTVSTESDPDNLNIVHAQIQKSPSFSLDLKNEARTEVSDNTPLLYQDKAEIESSASQVEKVITFERSESEESKTPFLGFLKEEEETHVVVPAENKHENQSASKNSKRNLDSVTGNATSTSSKGKEKRRHRPSLFSNCLCCATVIN